MLRKVVGAKREDDDSDDRERKAFLADYFHSLMHEGPALQSRIASIERFVELQRSDGNRAQLEIVLHGSVYDSAMALRVEKLGDIDFGDLHGATEMHTVELHKLQRSRWTDAQVGAIVRHMNDDLAEDGIAASLHAKIYKDKDPSNDLLVIRVEYETDQNDDEHE